MTPSGSMNVCEKTSAFRSGLPREIGKDPCMYRLNVGRVSRMIDDLSV
jgi:hypothetical protein